MPKIYIIAGEPSGDMYGGKLIEALRKVSKGAIELHGIGGEHMTAQGMCSIFPMSEISIMGFWEVLPHIPNVLNRINQTVDDILTCRPDVVITIDSPGFCCRVAEKLQGKGIKLIHYVAPTVWAYKPKRAEKFAKLFDHLLVILPFEPQYFTKHGLDTTYIGHPIIENQQRGDTKQFKIKYDIRDSDVVLCIMPGSRCTEISRLLTIFLDAAEIIYLNTNNLKVIIPTLSNLKAYIYESVEQYDFPVVVIDDPAEKHVVYEVSKAALVKSGTGTLEVALAKCPMVVAYKINPLSYIILKTMLNIKYANLINLIHDEEVIPEMLQSQCNSKLLAAKLEPLLKEARHHDKQLRKIDKALVTMGKGSKICPSDKAAKAIMQLL